MYGDLIDAADITVLGQKYLLFVYLDHRLYSVYTLENVFPWTENMEFQFVQTFWQTIMEWEISINEFRTLFHLIQMVWNNML